MTEPILHCAACNRPLGSDDQFCSQCGTPTPGNVDPDATIVNPARPDAAKSRTSSDEITAPAGLPASQAPLSATAFKGLLREVLGAEYVLISVIGQGGFARVYRAQDRRLDRIVAIKVIRPDAMGTKVFVDSFRNESIALAKLRHPGIVPIYDIRERHGLIYYIMPFVEGTTLDERLSQARLPPFESRRILSELADALGAAHRAKMIHLDIKPANIFLEGDLRKVLLMDFGIARALTKQGEDAPGGTVMGTPEYMSPEQARGLPEIDHRSDIYSLGALGYRMLTGRPPFTGRTAAETLEKHIKQAPVPIRDVNPTIPKDFADAIMRCLEKDPSRRFANALELRSVLDAVTFFSTPADREAAEAAARARKRFVAFLAVVAFLIGLLVGLAVGG